MDRSPVQGALPNDDAFTVSEAKSVNSEEVVEEEYEQACHISLFISAGINAVSICVEREADLFPWNSISLSLL
jgi:hypothetical protein